MAFPTSWTDPRYLVAVSGVLAVGALAVVLRSSGEFTPLLFGAGVLGVTVIAAAAMVLWPRID
ncbi:hypothetical protein ACFPYI_05800 [Halomarina salina]|uniref:Uncharacterized protein n=1 Tax=Halomarina salina TaxID=1872699 RepID=A0ABD5RJQ8_9EURY|nr:hypothetical protein [Halomarina salina]